MTSPGSRRVENARPAFGPAPVGGRHPAVHHTEEVVFRVGQNDEIGLRRTEAPIDGARAEADQPSDLSPLFLGRIHEEVEVEARAGFGWGGAVHQAEGWALAVAVAEGAPRFAVPLRGVVQVQLSGPEGRCAGNVCDAQDRNADSQHGKSTDVRGLLALPADVWAPGRQEGRA